MDVNAILDLAPDQAHTTLANYPNTKTIKYLNLVKDDLFAVLITSAGEDWNWDIWETNSVVNQDEYTLPEAVSDTEGNIKIGGISISYTGELEKNGLIKYKKAREVDLGNLPLNWNHYINNQSKEDPIYYVADKSIFIAPAPIIDDGAITDGIQIKGIKSIPDYAVDGTEASIKLPYYLHLTLVQGILPWIFKSRGKEASAEKAQLEYERQRDLAVDKFKNRSTAPLYMTYPDEPGPDLDDFIVNQTP